ncbi:hypothetical protein BGW80DRAFT_706463 [Lactifluus volemus]|nr:hypothetical protein BGW80DRAFT_706463 [Lactifluus volemus]
MDTLAKVGLGSDANLVLSEDKRGEIEAEGKAGAAAAAAASGLSFDATVQLIRFVRNSLMPEAGCRMLISIILLRVASAMHGIVQTMNILPEFPVEGTFQTDPDKYSFTGVVDYMLVRLPRGESGPLLGYPINADILDLLREVAVTGIVIRAEQDNMEQAIPRAALMVASYCKRQELSVIRGCITSGEQWTFFVFKSPKASVRRVVCTKREGVFRFSRQFNLGENLENLSLILGLLRDLTENAFEYNQNFFSYKKRV